MKEVALKAKKRDTGKQVSKQLRRDGMVPGVYYMNGAENINVAVEPLDLRPIVYTAHKKVISLQMEGMNEPKLCVLKDVKFDPISDAIVHFDLLGLNPEREVNVEVPVIMKGQSPGVRQGGSVRQTIHKVKINCLPANMCDSVEVDISKLEVGKSIHFRDLVYEGVRFEMPMDAMICACSMPRGSKTDDK